MSGFREYDQYDALGLAALVRNKKITPGEIVEEAIRRIEALNPQINAVIHKMYDRAREAAAGDIPAGPFGGVPFLLKDLISGAYAGAPLCNGSRFHKDYVADHTSALVKRYQAAGLIVVGKTNTPEYGLLPVTEPELFGPTNNPWDLGRTSGGSSGGAAAAVAARMVPLAHGSDGGGSIRIPASCCGLFGLKPTRGRTPAGPIIGEAWQGLSCSHVISRSVRDSAAALDATAGPDVGAPYAACPPARPFLEEVGADPGRLRIAFTSEPFLGDVVHEDCTRGLEAAVQLCQELGHELVEAAPRFDSQAFVDGFQKMAYVETRASIGESEAVMGRRATARDFEMTTWAAGLIGSRIGGPAFVREIRQLRRLARQIAQFFEDYDVLLTPTLAQPPLPTSALQPRGFTALGIRVLGGLNAGALLKVLHGMTTAASDIFKFIPYTPLANVTGQPAISVPLFWNDDGLPIGMQFMARYGDEATLFRLAGQLERAQPWFDRRPAICA
jgi:amidase